MFSCWPGCDANVPWMFSVGLVTKFWSIASTTETPTVLEMIPSKHVCKKVRSANYTENCREKSTKRAVSWINGLNESFGNINPFLAYVPILYPLKNEKTLLTRLFSGVFRGHKIGTLTRMGEVTSIIFRFQVFTRGIKWEH